MKRYIEIVYDNSGSMNELVGSKRKYEIAQDLFEKEILPTIGLRGDQVVLRLLRKDCSATSSNFQVLPNQRNVMLNYLKGINHDQSTPLFKTIYDAIETCKTIQANQHLIFVLTDGDDNCGVKIEKLIDEKTLKHYVKFYTVLLVQLAVNSSTSKNNLIALTNVLGGQSISLESTDSFPEMRKKVKSALRVSGFSNKIPLDHCFDFVPGNDLTWDEIAETGISFHQAMLLFQKDLLTWMPEIEIEVSQLQIAELSFLHSLIFNSGIPEDLTKTMLSQLKKPYYYSYDCIFWDFSAARWKYFIPQNKIDQLPNENAILDDFPERIMNDKTDNRYELYKHNQKYIVEEVISDILEFKITQDNSDEVNNQTKEIELRKGDRIIFKHRQ
jgi:hypothetical protein